jgi:hypothetical protein
MWLIGGARSDATSADLTTPAITAANDCTLSNVARTAEGLCSNPSSQVSGNYVCLTNPVDNYGPVTFMRRFVHAAGSGIYTGLAPARPWGATFKGLVSNNTLVTADGNKSPFLSLSVPLQFNKVPVGNVDGASLNNVLLSQNSLYRYAATGVFVYAEGGTWGTTIRQVLNGTNVSTNSRVTLPVTPEPACPTYQSWSGGGGGGTSTTVFTDSFLNLWSYLVPLTSPGNPGNALSTNLAAFASLGMALNTSPAAYTTVSFDVKGTASVLVGVAGPTYTGPATRAVTATGTWTRYTCSFPAMSTTGGYAQLYFQNNSGSGQIVSIDNITLGTGTQAVNTCSAGSVAGTAVFTDSFLNLWSYLVPLTSPGNPGNALSTNLAAFASLGMALNTSPAAYTTVSFDVKGTASVLVGVAGPTYTGPATRAVTATGTWTRYTCSFPAMSTTGGYAQLYFQNNSASDQIVSIDNITLGTGTQAVNTCA